MANSSIALENIPPTHRPITDRIGSLAAGEATATRLSREQSAYASSLGLKQVQGAALDEAGDNQSVVTILIEPNALLREGLRSILAETRYNPVAQASSLEDVSSIPVPEDGVSIFIMDAAQDHDNVYRQVREIKDRSPSSRVVMLVDKYELQQVLAAFHSGADAYLMKSISCEILLKTLDLVILGGSVFPAASLGSLGSRSTLVDPRPAKILSDRELAILRCLMDGHSNKVIARKLEIAEATVKVHIKTILRKISVKNRTQAAIWGMNHLNPDEDAPAHGMTSN